MNTKQFFDEIERKHDMGMYNDKNELKHPAFFDEEIEKKNVWSKIWDILFYVCITLGLVALVLSLTLGRYISVK